MNRGSSTKIKQKMKKSLKEKNRVPKYKQRVGNSKAALYWDYQIQVATGKCGSYISRIVLRGQCPNRQTPR